MTVLGSREGKRAGDGSPGVLVGMSSAPIAAADLLARMGTPAVGALVAFEGRVRDHSDGRDVRRLRYESYREMADEVLQEIRREALALYPVTQVGVLHRVGTLEIGEVSLVVVIASVHRGPALEAAHYTIEQLKVRLPVWKREEYADGTTGWVEGARANGT